MAEYASRQLVEGDRPLRRDLRLLGWQLRRLVQQHGGQSLWQSLQALRELAEQRLDGDEADVLDQIERKIKTMSVAELAELTRAMGLFFDMANVAEDRHRVRVLRDRQRRGRLSESLRAAARILSDLGPDRQQAILQSLSIEPVLTAHPTEAKRRSHRRATRRIRRDLYTLDRQDLLPDERMDQLTRMQRDLASLWYTDPVSPRKPSVIEELRRTLFATRVMWRVTPKILATLREAFGHRGLASDTPLAPLRFGSWIGGDRDGNPNVTTAVTRRTLGLLRRTAIRMHRRQCQQVRHRLTVSARRAGLSGQIKQHVDRVCAAHPKLREAVDRLHPDEWLVQWLHVIEYRLVRSEALPGEQRHALAYGDTAELLADVQRVVEALRQAGHDELLAGALQRWHDRISTFGLHLLRLDIRINSTDLVELVSEIARQVGQCDDYAALDEPDRRAMLSRWPVEGRAAQVDGEALSEDAAERWALFGLIQQLARSGGASALGNIIISMTHQPSDVLACAWLMKLAALDRGDERHAAIPVVPLFETVDDLDRSGQILHEMLGDPDYRAHVEACDDEQVCMVGYSDSAKDGGYVASNWSLYRAQERLSDVSRQHGVRLTVFHGRGGAIGRGGGPAARAIHSLPPQAVDGRLRLTEQGEVIAERYDDPAIAQRHLEQLFWATLTVQHEHGTPPDADRRALINELAQTAEQTYRDLVGMDQFVDYQKFCTALSLIESLQIGSRPSRRRGVKSLEDLRAIPFTFAWNQVRMPINAFYGLGSAYEALDKTQRQQAATLYEQWPWFRAVIDNAELALARCDAAITRRYVALSPDPEAAMALWRQLAAELQRSTNAVQAIKGEARLLSHVPWLRRTVRVRLPYLDMLNLIQIELMSRRAVAYSADTDAIDHALRGSVQAIAAGLRNTG